VLRFAQNPRDRVAGFRLLQLIPGVGPSSAQRVLDLMADQASPLFGLWRIPAPPRSGVHWNAFVEVLQQLNTGGAGWPTDMEHARRWYEPHLERIHEDAAMRQADLLATDSDIAIAKQAGLDRLAVRRIRQDPAKAEAALASWEALKARPRREDGRRKRRRRRQAGP
jgi:hypothetical protein